MSWVCQSDQTGSAESNSVWKQWLLTLIDSPGWRQPQGGAQNMRGPCSRPFDNTHKEKHETNLVQVEQKDLGSYFTVTLFSGVRRWGLTWWVVFKIMLQNQQLFNHFFFPVLYISNPIFFAARWRMTTMQKPLVISGRCYWHTSVRKIITCLHDARQTSPRTGSLDGTSARSAWLFSLCQICIFPSLRQANRSRFLLLHHSSKEADW